MTTTMLVSHGKSRVSDFCVMLPDSSRLSTRSPKSAPSGSMILQISSAYVRVPMV